MLGVAYLELGQSVSGENRRYQWDLISQLVVCFSAERIKRSVRSYEYSILDAGVTGSQFFVLRSLR